MMMNNKKERDSMIFDEQENYLPDFSLEIDDKIKIDYRTYAKIITNHCTKLRKGQTVLISGLYAALPLIKEIYREILNTGAYPVRPIVDFPGRRFLLYNKATDDLLKMTDPMAEFYNSKVDVVISIYDQLYPEELDKIPKERIRINEKAYIETYKIKNKRIKEGKHQEIFIGYPFSFNASRNNMDLIEYQNLFEKIHLLDKVDPLAAWAEMEKKGNKIIQLFKKYPQIHVKSKNIDLKFDINPKRLLNSMGQEYLPDGKITAALDPSSVNGHIIVEDFQILENVILKSLKIAYINGKIQFEELKKKFNPQEIESIKKSYGSVLELGIGVFPISQLNIDNPMIRFLNTWGMTFIFEGIVNLSFGSWNDDPQSNTEDPTGKKQIFDLRKDGEILADEFLLFKNGHLNYSN